MPTKAENLVKIGPVLAESVGYADLCRFVLKVNFLPSNLWVYWTDLDQSAQNVAKNIAT